MTKVFKNAVEAVKPGTDDKKSVIPYSYQMSLEDMQDLILLAVKGHIYKALHLAFNFGFVMGNRCTIRRNMKRL